MGVHVSGEEGRGRTRITEGRMRSIERCADCPAAVREAAPVEHGEVVLRRFQGAQGWKVRHVPAGSGVFGANEGKVEVGVVRGDRGAG